MKAPAQQSASAGSYLRTKVLTAPPEQLRLMLLDGCVKFARQGRDGLAAKDYEASYNGFSKCRNILMELINSMRPEHDPELCARLTGLYTFLFNHLVEGAFEKDLVKIDKVIELLDYERQTWSLLIDQLAGERAGANAAATSSAAIEPDSNRPLVGALSVEG